MFSLQSWFSRSRDARRRTTRRSRSRPCGLEPLEGRTLLTLPHPPILPPAVVAGLAINSKYAALGGSKGILGAATTSLSSFNGGYDVQFRNGAIFYSAKTGAHYLDGAIATEYFETASEKDPSGNNVQKTLGLPTADQGNVPGVAGTQVATFEGGRIYSSSATGPLVLEGPIYQEYLHTASETDAYGNNVQKILGIPTTGEGNWLWGNGNHVQTFQGGDIFWSASTGAHVVYGAILAEFQNTFNETDYYNNDVMQLLGMPTSDEVNVRGVSGARMNTFQGGEIIWSAQTGAHVVYGAIGNEYMNNLGGPSGSYGLPTSDEQAMANGGRVSYFQNGKIYWTPPVEVLGITVGGVREVPAVNSMSFSANVTFSGSTPVGGWVSLVVYADGSYDFSGHLHDSGFPSYNDALVLGIESPSGALYTFTHTGHMNGTVEVGSRDDDWNVWGPSAAIADNWADLEGASGNWDVSTSNDWNSVLNQLEAGVDGFVVVVQVLNAGHD